ncbi:MAG TPA: AraC family transcriptional regulator [Cyclobacteriaceae bacterium]|nr:AraC family transcriptional regulator [Cyclobacteriaceae bacterium]HRJ80954.1 AraC family transcriptional regulator [Cyclobacteriaceae bacterium]
MKAFQLHIRNMVCDRCIIVVRQILKQLKVIKPAVGLGHASFFSAKENIISLFQKKLNEVGLHIIINTDEVLIEKIKLEVIHYLDALEQRERTKNFSDWLQRRSGKNYNHLSKFFKDHEQINLETYVIHQKVERVKRLIREGELSLKKIAERLRYASLQHLSARFRSVTGITITQFRKLNRIEPTYNSMKEAIADLHSRGYTIAFELKGNHLLYSDCTTRIRLNETSLKEIYRFEDRPGKSGKSALFEVTATNGLKGYVLCH